MQGPVSLVPTGNKCLVSYVLCCCAGILKSRTTPEQERAYNSILDRRETEGEASKHQAVHDPHVPNFNSLSCGFTIIYSFQIIRYGFSSKADSKKNPVYGTLWPQLMFTPESTPNTCFHEQPYARADLNPMPETLSTSQELWIWPLDPTFKLGRAE